MMIAKDIFQSKKVLLMFILILFIGFLLRILRILYYQQPIFADEAIYIRWAQVMQAEATLRFLPLSDGKQPLFMWVLIPFLKIIRDPLIAGRLLSTVTGLGTIVGIFILSLNLFKSKKAALTASLMYAISPFSVFFDTMALVDSMLAMFGVWVLVFAVLTVKKIRLDTAMLTGFSLGGALLTKSPGIFFSLLIPVTLLFAQFPKKLKGIFNLLSVYVFIFAFTFLIGYGMYNILRLGPNFHMIGLRNQDYVFPISHLWENPKDPFIFHVQEIIEWFWILGPSVIVLIIPFGLIVRFNKFKKEIILLLAWIAFPLFINSMYAKVFTARYVLFVLPFTMILGAAFYMNSVKSKFKTLLLLIFIIHSLSINMLFIKNIQGAPLPKNERSGYLEEWTAGYGIKEVAQYFKEYRKNNPDKKIVVGTEGYFGTLPDGLQLYLAKYPEITVIGVGLDINQLPVSLKESKLSGNSTFLVINNSRLKAKPEDLGLDVVAAYPKALRSVGTKEYNLLGPQETLYLFEVTGEVNKNAN